MVHRLALFCLVVAAAVGVSARQSSAPVAGPVAAADDRATVAERVPTVTRASVWTPRGHGPHWLPHLPSAGHGEDRRHALRVVRRGQGADARFAQPSTGTIATSARASGICSRSIRRDTSSRDLTLGEGAIYHPGGIDYDGRHIWVPLSEYRPEQPIDHLSGRSGHHEGARCFAIADSIGAHRSRHRRPLAARRQLGIAPLLSLDARRGGRVTNASVPPGTLRTLNTSHYVDYQDCKYARPASHAVHRRHRDAPVAARARVPARRDRSRRSSRTAVRCTRCPLPLWTPSGLDMTHNPFWLEPHGDRPARLLHARGRSVNALCLRRDREVGGHPPHFFRLRRTLQRFRSPCSRRADLQVRRACRA